MPKDPFAGLRLSEQSTRGKLDQRLFSPRAKGVATPLSGTGEGTVAEHFVKANTSPPPPVRQEPLSVRTKFDLQETPLYKASFLFTQDELEALEDLKIELRRSYDQKVTKNDLIRSALHMLLEDHAAGGIASYATRKVGPVGKIEAAAS
jgi:hypothetical protein